MKIRDTIFTIAQIVSLFIAISALFATLIFGVDFAIYIAAGAVIFICLEVADYWFRNTAKHKRNEIKSRFMAIKRDIANVTYDGNGMIANDALDNEYVRDNNGAWMTAGDLMKQTIQYRNAMNIKDKLARRKKLNEIASKSSIGRKELERMANQLNYDTALSLAEDKLFDTIHDGGSRQGNWHVSMSKVRYEDAPSTVGHELQLEAARLKMTNEHKEVRVGNGMVKLAAYNYDGHDVFGIDDEGTVYMPAGMRWTEATTDSINEALDDMKKVATP